MSIATPPDPLLHVVPPAGVRSPAPRLGTWWRIGATCSVVTLAVFGTVGVAWTKVLGLW